MSSYMNVLKRLDETRRETAPRGRRAVVEALRPVAPAVAATAAVAPVATTPAVAAPIAPALAAPVVPVRAASSPAVATPTARDAWTRATTPAAPRVEPRAEPRVEPRIAPRSDAHPASRAAAPVGFTGFAELFDRIQLFAQGRERCVVVLAPASHAESIGRVMSAMVAHAEQRHERAFFAELRGRADACTLVPRAGQGNGRDSATPLAIDPADHATPGLLSEWLDTHAPGDRLILLEAPPLSNGLDAALLARACDGLIVVAEAEVTEREALHVAGERARASGCNTLGIAMVGSSDPMPRWLARLLRRDTND